MDCNKEKREDSQVENDDNQLVRLKKMKKTKLLEEILTREKKLKEVEDILKKTELELEKCKASEISLKEQLLRMQADFENYKKREEKKKQEFMDYAKQDLIYQLLSVVDNLERASCYTDDQTTNEKHLENIKQGLKGILKDFQNILEKEGLKPIKAIGEKFDPYCHEAIMHVPSERFPEDTVIEELIKGYYLKSKVLRPSLVKVSKGPDDKQKDTKSKQENLLEKQEKMENDNITEKKEEKGGN